jgi:multimeric flavodoxin WrbA
MNKAIIIFGNSSRPNDNRSLVDEVARQLELKIIDLAEFDFNSQEANDHLIEIIENIINVDTIIFATPVYSYSMSVRMKLFIDQLGELSQVDEELKEILLSKRGLLLSTGNNAMPPEYFEQTFSLLLAYLGIKYSGMLYRPYDTDFTPDQIRTFGNKAMVQADSWSTVAA